MAVVSPSGVEVLESRASGCLSASRRNALEPVTMKDVVCASHVGSSMSLLDPEGGKHSSDALYMIAANWPAVSAAQLA